MICPLCEQSDGVMDNYCHRCSQDLDGYVLPEPVELEIIPGSDVKNRKQNWNPPPKLTFGPGVMDARRVALKDEIIYLDNISEDMKAKMKEVFDKLTPEQKEEFMNPKIFVGFGELVKPEEEDLMIGLDLTDEDCYVKPRVMYMSYNDRS